MKAGRAPRKCIQHGPSVIDVEVLAAGVRVGEMDAAEGHLHLVPRRRVLHLLLGVGGCGLSTQPTERL